MTALIEVPDERAFVARFVRLFLDYTVENPPPKVISTVGASRYVIARVLGVTLQAARAAGIAGIPSASLRAAYNELDVPAELRNLVERKLTTDGVVRIVGDRMVFAGTRSTWLRLAETPA